MSKKWPDDYDPETVAMSGGTGMPAKEWAEAQDVADWIVSAAKECADRVLVGEGERAFTEIIKRHANHATVNAAHEMLLRRDAAWSKAIGAVIGYDTEACGAVTPSHMAQLLTANAENAKMLTALIANNSEIIAYMKKFEWVVCLCDEDVGFVCEDCAQRRVWEDLARIERLLTPAPAAADEGR